MRWKRDRGGSLTAAFDQLASQYDRLWTHSAVGQLQREAVWRHIGKLFQRGQAALTGPVARGDAAAVAAHLRALTQVDPELAQAYRVNALRTAQRAHAPSDVVEVLVR